MLQHFYEYNQLATDVTCEASEKDYLDILVDWNLPRLASRYPEYFLGAHIHFTPQIDAFLLNNTVFKQ